jgi:hypothetical protein
VLKFVENQIRTTQPKDFGKPLTYARDSFTEPWMLELYDCRFVRVWCGELEGEYAARYLCLDLSTDEICKFGEAPDGLVFTEINLSAIEKALDGGDV